MEMGLCTLDIRVLSPNFSTSVHTFCLARAFYDVCIGWQWSHSNRCSECTGCFCVRMMRMLSVVFALQWNAPMPINTHPVSFDSCSPKPNSCLIHKFSFRKRLFHTKNIFTLLFSFLFMWMCVCSFLLSSSFFPAFSSHSLCYDLWIMDVFWAQYEAGKRYANSNRFHVIKCRRTFIHFAVFFFLLFRLLVSLLLAKIRLFSGRYIFFSLDSNSVHFRSNSRPKNKIYLPFVSSVSLFCHSFAHSQLRTLRWWQYIKNLLFTSVSVC